MNDKPSLASAILSATAADLEQVKQAIAEQVKIMCDAEKAIRSLKSAQRVIEIQLGLKIRGKGGGRKQTTTAAIRELISRNGRMDIDDVCQELKSSKGKVTSALSRSSSIMLIDGEVIPVNDDDIGDESDDVDDDVEFAGGDDPEPDDDPLGDEFPVDDDFPDDDDDDDDDEPEDRPVAVKDDREMIGMIAEYLKHNGASTVQSIAKHIIEEPSTVARLVTADDTFVLTGSAVELRSVAIAKATARSESSGDGAAVTSPLSIVAVANFIESRGGSVSLEDVAEHFKTYKSVIASRVKCSKSLKINPGGMVTFRG